MKTRIWINFIIGSILAIFLFATVQSQSEQTQTNDETQTVKDITVEEAQILIEKNKDNSNLIILDEILVVFFREYQLVLYFFSQKGALHT